MSEVSKELQSSSVSVRDYPIIMSAFLTIVYGLLLFGILYPVGTAFAYLFLENDLLSLDFALILFFLILFLSMFILWMVIVPFVFKLPNGRESFRDYNNSIGFKQNLPLMRPILIGIGFSIVIFLSWFIVVSLTSSFSPSLEKIFSSPNLDTDELGWFIFLLAFLPGVWEEVAFRGVIFKLLKKKYSQEATILFSGVLFGIFHFFNLIIGSITPSTVIYQVIFASIVGISFGYLRMKTRSLVPCIIVHYSVDSIISTTISALFIGESDLTLYSPIGIIIHRPAGILTELVPNEL